MVILTTAIGWASLSQTVESRATDVSSDRMSVGSSVIGDTPRFVFHGGTPARQEGMWSSIGRFTDLGLELPRLEIVFAQGCRERFEAWGRIEWSAEYPWWIEVYTTGIYLHELAYAWDRWNLTDAERSMYRDPRGIEAWTGSDIAWMEHGEENLATLGSRWCRRPSMNWRTDRPKARWPPVLVAVSSREGRWLRWVDAGSRQDARLNSPRSTLASLRSPVSNPSVNQP